MNKKSSVYKIFSKDMEAKMKGTYRKKYKCPYCELRATVSDLALHIGDEHQDMIPKDMTPFQLAVNARDKKDSRPCLVCGKPVTKWNQDTGRYESFCSDDCRKKYAKSRKAQRDKLGDTVYQREVMLKNKSKTYTFRDGTKMDYIGTYELEFLKYMDTELKIDPMDLQQAYPVIPYQYKGKTHHWFMDFYYKPYNLAIEIKDGGDNPNTRPMEEYREKQFAKEEAITKLGQYNYIRCTNKDFNQIVEILEDLREEGNDPRDVKIIRVHESTVPLASVPPVKKDDVYIINYMQNNVFSEPTQKFALCKSYMSDIVEFDKGSFSHISLEDFKQKAINPTLFKYIGENGISYMNIVDLAETDKDFYEILTGKKLYSYDQIHFDKTFEKTMPFTRVLDLLEECTLATITAVYANTVKGITLPKMALYESTQLYDSIKYYRDLGGVYAINEETGIRTASYENKEEIPSDAIEFIKNKTGLF